jgi:crotonobetainyl-CoA:carnitine CoA-transferase CaiB-like acyl-CoA transferase
MWLDAASGINPYFESYNRSKRGIVLDLKSERGRQIMYRLIEGCDVFISNLRAPALTRLGLDYDTLQGINSRLVYGHASGFGPSGPDRDAPAMDLLGQARSGLMSVTGEPDDPPLPAGSAIGDQTGAIVLALGVAVALVHRERTGQGQRVDSSLLGGLISVQNYPLMNSILRGNLVPQRPRRAGITATWNVYKGSDGKWFVISMGLESYWPRICRTVGRENWIVDPRYARIEDRVQNAESLIADLDKTFSERPADEWVRAFLSDDLPASRVNDYAEVAKDPQVLENGYIRPVEHPDRAEPVWMVDTPISFSQTPASIRNVAPEFGQHTEEVLLEHGFDWDELVKLREDGIIGART